MPRDPEPGRPTNVLRGILWMTFTAATAAMADATVKSLGQTFPVVQVVWARFTIQVAIVFLLFAPRLPQLLVTQRPFLQLLRSTFLAAAAFFMTLALTFLPLAEVSAILFLAPLVVAALSAPLLGEKVRPGCWIAIGIGFTGILVIVRPGGAFMQWAALLPLIPAVSYALFQVATRSLSRTEDPRTTLLYTGLAGAVGLSFLVPFHWRTPDMTEWLWLSVPAVLAGLSHFGLIRALAWAPAAVIAPFDYSRLIWAVMFGFIIFGDLPNLWTLVGAAIIVGGGLYIFQTEKKRD